MSRPNVWEIIDWCKPAPATDRQIECMKDLDSSDYEIYSRKLEMICKEGRETFMRMGISTMAESGDLASGLHTAQGDVCIAMISVALHLVLAQNGIKYIMKQFQEDPTVGVRPGDMFYFNDARYGGVHNADQIMAMPIFFQEELIGWVSQSSHEVEMGASEPGGHSYKAKSIYDDGLTLSPIKVGENYRLKTDLLQMMEGMVRDPRAQTLDVKARAAACEVMIRRVIKIAEDKGIALLIGVMRRMIEETAKGVGKKLLELNDGVFRQPLFHDRIGYNPDQSGLLRCMVTLRKEGNKATIDYTGSSPRVVGGNFNTHPHAMIAQTAGYYYQFFCTELKPNAGVFAPFEYVIPKGSFMDADWEDATSRAVGTGVFDVQALHICFEKLLFESPYGEDTQAPWPIPGTTVVAGLNQFGMVVSAFDQGIPNGCGAGARRHYDGLDTTGFAYSFIGEYPDTEHFELSYPLLCLFRSKFFTDNYGPGKYRGGRGIMSLYLVHDVPAVALFCLSSADRYSFPPGIFGGYPSRPNNPITLKDSNLPKLLAEASPELPYGIQDLFSKVKEGKITGDLAVHADTGVALFKSGDALCFYSGGGSGYGDVLERPPELVIKDVREEATSPWQAQKIFKVAYDPETFEVDYEETQRLRGAERAARKKRGKPYAEFEKEWLAKRPKAEILGLYGKWPEAMSN